MNDFEKLLEMKAQRKTKRDALKAMLKKDGMTEEVKGAMEELKRFGEGVEALEALLDEEKKLGTVEGEPIAKVIGKAQEPQAQDGYKVAVKALAAAARAGFRIEKASAGTAMTEGVAADGGYTVPKDIVNRVIKLRDAQSSLLEEVTVVPVTTNSGARTYQKRSQHKGFTTRAEKAAMKDLATPEFAQIEYKIETRDGFFPVTRELMEDSDENIAAIIEEWMAAESVATANNEIVAEVKRVWSSPVAVKTADDLQEQWIKLGPAFRSVSKLVTNTDGIAWLGKQKDGTGRAILNEVTGKPGVMQLSCGTYTIPVVEKDNDALPNNTTKIPFLIGSMKDAIRYWDRRQLSIERSTSAVVGSFNAFQEGLELWKGGIRDDCTAFDEEALVFCEVNTAEAAALSADEPAPAKGK